MCDHCGCRSIPAIAELTFEHEEILERAWVVAEAQGSDDAPSAVERLLEVLDRHVEKEEHGLYPLLTETGDLTPAARQAFEAEHAEIREALVAGGFDRQRYYALSAHAEAEENELFPVALFGFDDVDWEQMEAVHRSVDARRPGSPR
jgi:hemerythrin-like domain-containing protein